MVVNAHPVLSKFFKKDLSQVVKAKISQSTIVNKTQFDIHSSEPDWIQEVKRLQDKISHLT